MERRIHFSIDRTGYLELGIWKDLLLKNEQIVQQMEFKFEMPIDIRKRSSNAILLHTHLNENPFFVTLDPSTSTIKYQQGRDENIMLISNIKDTLKDQLIEYFNDVSEGEKPLGAFEFTDKENVQDPSILNQTAGKRRRKTRRHRRS